MLKFSCAQIPARIGDFDFNLAQIIEAARNAQDLRHTVTLQPSLVATAETARAPTGKDAQRELGWSKN